MKNLIFTATIAVVLFSVVKLQAQVALNGTVQIIPYQGLQPELIEGVSALPAFETPLIRHVCLVDKNILSLTIDEQAVITNILQPYKKEPGDTILMKGYHGQSKVLKRKGEEIAYLCGVKENWYRPFDIQTGEKLDLEWISNPENFKIYSNEDSSFVKEVIPLKVYRKTYPNRRPHVAQRNNLAMQHEIYLVLPEALKTGNAYTLEFDGGSQMRNPVTFNFNENRLRSEAIHVNLFGFEPEDPKIAFLSAWMGDGGALSYGPNLGFKIIDVKTNKAVYEGKPTLKSRADQPEYSIDNNDFNHNLTDVYALDFSELNTPGSYRIVVPGIGCSFDFEIRSGMWEDFTRLNMKGFLHQRSGIELGPPYTDYLRPRNMHPDDEVTINKCDVKKFFENDASGQQGIFQRIQNSILPETEVPEAWGGWMDAGDFDQRMTHLYTVFRLMYLYEMNPGYFENLDLNIPESENNIPDILDEARWCLDLYKRTQGVYEKGGISWWVESIEHPRGGEASWQNSLPTALVPPTPDACLVFASCAAQMSLTVKKYNIELADEYLESALDAMNWVKNNPGVPHLFARNSQDVNEAMAFVNLYRATGKSEWHQKMIEKLEVIFKSEIKNEVNTSNVEILINYLLAGPESADEKLFKQSREAIIHLADELLAGAAENTYYIFRTKKQPLTRTVLPGRTILPVAMAHFLTGDKKYTDALSLTVQHTMGANPMNRSYVSGLGERWFIPYQHDFDVTATPAPAGISQFGPATQSENRWGWTGKWAIDMVEGHGLHPNKLLEWPFTEKCFNNTWIAPINEFTVRHPMGELIMLSGYLAQIK